MMDMEKAFQSLFFYALALLTVGSAAVVAGSRNIVRSAFALLATLFGVAGLYAVAGADFLAGIQLLVYVGGILVLILFAVMLTHRISNINLSNESAPGPVAFAIVAALLFLLGLTVTGVAWPLHPGFPGQETPGKPQVPQTYGIGWELMSGYLLPFEIVSVLLLAALIGAAYLARKELRDQKE